MMTVLLYISWKSPWKRRTHKSGKSREMMLTRSRQKPLLLPERGLALRMAWRRTSAFSY
ncbi:MAG: hypothetical protein HFH87_18925 [Lachnospiraceae bacterium]|nr:hypothetical protein [Lachnospiraceae bacterium]